MEVQETVIEVIITTNHKQEGFLIIKMDIQIIMIGRTKVGKTQPVQCVGHNKTNTQLGPNAIMISGSWTDDEGLSIQGVGVSLLVDTGTTISILSTSLVKSLPHSLCFELQKVNKHLSPLLVHQHNFMPGITSYTQGLLVKDFNGIPSQKGHVVPVKCQ